MKKYLGDRQSPWDTESTKQFLQAIINNNKSSQLFHQTVYVNRNAFLHNMSDLLRTKGLIVIIFEKAKKIL